MKRFQILLASSLLLALIVIGCSDHLQEVSETPAVQARMVASTSQHYSLITGNQQSVYSAQVTEYTDGSVQVIRTVIPYDPNLNYVHSVLSRNIPISKSGQGTQVDFSSTDGWFVPFDPGAQPVRIFDKVIGIDCNCDNGPTGCNVDVQIDPVTDKLDIGCRGDVSCTGNCIASLHFGPSKLTGDGGILIHATEVHLP